MKKVVKELYWLILGPGSYAANTRCSYDESSGTKVFMRTTKRSCILEYLIDVTD
jgi:hypothetical protein